MSIKLNVKGVEHMLSLPDAIAVRISLDLQIKAAAEKRKEFCEQQLKSFQSEIEWINKNA